MGAGAFLEVGREGAARYWALEGTWALPQAHRPSAGNGAAARSEIDATDSIVGVHKMTCFRRFRSSPLPTPWQPKILTGVCEKVPRRIQVQVCVAPSAHPMMQSCVRLADASRGMGLLFRRPLHWRGHQASTLTLGVPGVVPALGPSSRDFYFANTGIGITFLRERGEPDMMLCR